MYTATESIRWSMLCIWYLFLWMASFNFLESKAILTDLSFFTVITTGLINSSSEHFSNFIICLSSINFLSLFSTFSRRCKGTRRPLCWDGVYSDLKIDFAMWFFERPSRVHKCGYFCNTHFIIFFSVWSSEISLKCLPVFFEALRVIRSFASRSLPVDHVVRFVVYNKDIAALCCPRP